MERNKMEKEFSHKLNQREIQPSAVAWDRLDAMLSAAEAQPKAAKSKRNFKWLYVAAGFLGFLFVGTLFFKQEKGKSIADPEQNQVVEAPKSDASGQNATVPASETQIAEIPAESASAKANRPAVVKKVNKITSRPEKKQQLADNSIINHNQNPVIDQKTQLNQTQIAQEASVDELLAAARAKRENSASGAKVNARNLLLEVDSQSEEKLTPKQRALRALNRNYQQVKIAVETRNLDESH